MHMLHALQCKPAASSRGNRGSALAHSVTFFPLSLTIPHLIILFPTAVPCPVAASPLSPSHSQFSPHFLLLLIHYPPFQLPFPLLHPHPLSPPFLPPPLPSHLLLPLCPVLQVVSDEGSPVLHHRTMTGVEPRWTQLQQPLQRPHVVIQVLKHLQGRKGGRRRTALMQ